MQDYRKLLVWQKAHRFCVDLYIATRRFPREELFGLTSQIRRAVSSVPFNIVEGCGKATQKSRLSFFDTAMGSACEVEYALLLVKDLGMLEPERYADFAQRVEEIKRMLASLMETLRRDIEGGQSDT